MVRVVLDLGYHDGQLEVAQHPARFKVLVAGRRWGKTRLGGTQCVKVGLEGGRAWWVAPTYPMATEGWRPLRAMGHDIPDAEVREGDREIRFPGGGLVQVRSADDPQRLRGAGLDFLVLDEAAFMKPEAWEVLRPAMTDRKGQALFISTPKGIDNWFHRLWLDAETRPDWARWQFPTVANPHIDPDEVADARLELGSLIYSQEYEAEFITTGGTLFKSEWLRYYTTLMRDGLTWFTVPIPEREPWLVDFRECERFCTVDLAASVKEHADYTVICSAASYKGKLIVLEVVRKRLEGPDILPEVRRQMDRWGLGVAYIEHAGFQLALIQQARREGLAVKELRPDRDKIARALPLQARMEAGDVLFSDDAAWVPDLERELLAFPASEHDDQVDALAYAAQVLGESKRRVKLDGWEADLGRVAPSQVR